MSLRGLIRNYARLLGADGAAVVASLDGQAHAPAAANLAASRSLHGGGLPVDEERSTGGSWGWIIVIVALLAVGVAYAFWQGWLPRQWLPSQWF